MQYSLMEYVVFRYCISLVSQFHILLHYIIFLNPFFLFLEPKALLKGKKKKIPRDPVNPELEEDLQLIHVRDSKQLFIHFPIAHED